MALPHAAPGEVVRLQPLSAVAGAKTTALVKTDSFEAVHLVVRAGTRIAPHSVDGYFTLHCLEGAITLETESKPLTLGAGDWVYLERGEKHGLTAGEDSSLLLTILFDNRAA